MKKQSQNLVLVFLALILSFASYSQEKLEVEGAIIIKNSEDAAPVPGTIRFNPTTNDFEGWNGIYWASLTGNQYELGEMTDQDGNTYPTIIIGTQEWMAENLRTTKYRNNDPNQPNPPITLIGNDEAGNTAWGAANYGAYSSYDSNFGYLYNWYAVADTRGLCPTGWHVPSDAEWSILTEFLGGSSVAGGAMKEAGNTHWISQSMGATNSSGFTGLPGGYRDADGTLSQLGINGYWWSSTATSSSNAWNRYLLYPNAAVFRSDKDKKLGYSVRCVRE